MMRKISISFLVLSSLIILQGCEKESINLKSVEDVGLKVSFNRTKAAVNFKDASSMTFETPANYFVALKSARLIGTGDTEDAILFEEPDLSSSFVFDFTDDNTVHSLLQDSEVPDGDYSGIEVEIYYLQMNIAIGTGERGIERRNFRIYLSDDAETEGGMHQPGDMTQINNGEEIGWLLGENLIPNMDPVTPRLAAYTAAGDGSQWYDFAGKSAEHFGPFGDLEFANTAPHPIYNVIIDFDFKDNKGTNLILDFDVEDCWQFEDKSGDGVYGPDDLDPVHPTKWHMALPEMTITLN